MKGGKSEEPDFQKHSPPDWSNLKVLQRNVLPPRSPFVLYSDKASALAQDVQNNSICLSGLWKLQVVDSPLEAPEVPPHYEDAKWAEVQVPGMWQLQGFGRPQYSNYNYLFPVNPPHAPSNHNQCGTFFIPKLLQGHQLRLRFEGVDSAFHLFINGKQVGYSQGSRNPSEFDITNFITSTQVNELGVKVYQFSDGSYIEDQV
jgi:beta-galactosidase